MSVGNLYKQSFYELIGGKLRHLLWHFKADGIKKFARTGNNRIFRQPNESFAFHCSIQRSKNRALNFVTKIAKTTLTKRHFSLRKYLPRNHDGGLYHHNYNCQTLTKIFIKLCLFCPLTEQTWKNY